MTSTIAARRTSSPSRPIGIFIRTTSASSTSAGWASTSEDFADALKRVLRQDPDIILIGEMRDRETIQAAIKAAETGHLVFSTLHTADSVQTVDRILKYFDATEQELIRMQLSLNLQGVVSQRLLRKASGKGRLPAVEVLVNTPIVQKLIFEGRTKDLKDAVKNREDGMQTFDQCLLEYVQKKQVTAEEALLNVDNRAAFVRMMKGGFSDSDRGGSILR
ncbi:Flp pilus assembly complex ATPase component TadA [bacterium]|nr:Flp pilus assembly complex ATPase component TadA [bacterium]